MLSCWPEIKLWKDKYILNAPIAGKITFTKYWAENQNIIIGDRLATIVPEDSTQIIGRITIPSSGLGKVEVGQQVNVKLNGFRIGIRLAERTVGFHIFRSGTTIKKK